MIQNERGIAWKTHSKSYNHVKSIAFGWYAVHIVTNTNRFEEKNKFARYLLERSSDEERQQKNRVIKVYADANCICLKAATRKEHATISLWYVPVCRSVGMHVHVQLRMCAGRCVWFKVRAHRARMHARTRWTIAPHSNEPLQIPAWRLFFGIQFFIVE